MNRLAVDALLRAALSEDLGGGDVTTELLPEAARDTSGVLLAREGGLLCGATVAARCFTLLDDGVRVDLRLADGDSLRPGAEIGTVRGRAASLLASERVALNLLQRLSGIATLARRLAERAAPAGIRIVETRKTTPGLRLLEKYAVRVGSGYNHRYDLSSAVMLKDNHFALSKLRPEELVRRVRGQASHALSVIAEAGSPALVEPLLAGGCDVLLLDNFTPEQVRAAVQTVRGRAVIEVSGSIDEHNLDAYLIPGVNVISVGALTHSPRALDIGLELGH